MAPKICVVLPVCLPFSYLYVSDRSVTAILAGAMHNIGLWNTYDSMIVPGWADCSHQPKLYPGIRLNPQYTLVYYYVMYCIASSSVRLCSATLFKATTANCIIIAQNG